MGHRIPLLTPTPASASLVLALSLAAGTLSCAAPDAQTPPAASPDAAQAAEALPPVPVATLAGEPADVARVADGRVALVSLWATWCDACDREMDALNRLNARTMEGRDAVVIGVAVGEEREKVAAFAQRRGLRYAQLVDEHFAFADALGQRRVPATLVVDRNGRIVYRGDALDGRGLDALRRAITAH